MNRPTVSAVVEAIAQDKLGIPTLDARNSDALDFHDLAVWQIRVALTEAFEAGRRAAMTGAK